MILLNKHLLIISYVQHAACGAGVALPVRSHH